MIIQLILTRIERIFNSYNFSDISKLMCDNASFEEYIIELNPSQTKVFEEKEFKRIRWEDEKTLFIVRFSKEGKLLFIEREVWYEYTLPFFHKVKVMDNRYVED